MWRSAQVKVIVKNNALNSKIRVRVCVVLDHTRRILESSCDIDGCSHQSDDKAMGRNTDSSSKSNPNSNNRAWLRVAPVATVAVAVDIASAAAAAAMAADSRV
jgi:hypothetical protein